MIIACSSDSNYALPLSVTLYSTLINTSPHVAVTLYMLDAGMEPRQRERIATCIRNSGAMVDVHWLKVDVSGLQTYGSRKWMTGAAYSRLFLPELIPSCVEKIIYLDADLIVRRDLQELWNLDLGNYALAAARDQAIGVVSSIWGISNFHQIGLDPNTPYFNSGVMIINLKKWRALNIPELVFDYVRKNNSAMRLNDQEALNAILSDDWLEVDPRWNQHPRVFSYQHWANSVHKDRYKEIINDLIGAPYIIHYAAKPKPWEKDSMHPFQRVWLYYLKESGWHSSIQWNQWWASLLYDTIISSINLLIHRTKKVFPKDMKLPS